MSSTLLHLVRNGDPDPAAIVTAPLVDRVTERAINVEGNVTLAGRSPSVHLVARWERIVVDDGEPNDSLIIGGANGFSFDGNYMPENGASFTLADPDVMRAIATLLTELAERVDADRAAYGESAR